jgi:hypothetical protein
MVVQVLSMWDVLISGAAEFSPSLLVFWFWLWFSA